MTGKLYLFKNLYFSPAVEMSVRQLLLRCSQGLVGAMGAVRGGTNVCERCHHTITRSLFKVSYSCSTVRGGGKVRDWQFVQGKFQVLVSKFTNMNLN